MHSYTKSAGKSGYIRAITAHSEDNAQQRTGCFRPSTARKIVDPVITFGVVFDVCGDLLKLLKVGVLALIILPIRLAAVRQSGVTILRCIKCTVGADLQNDKLAGLSCAGTGQAAFLGINASSAVVLPAIAFKAV